jgi:hypothetical protein
MAAGVLIGRFLPAVPEFLGQFTYAEVSIPIAILIWLMIYPMMMKVDFASVKFVGNNPKGLFVTWVVNWLIKPFTMFGIAWFFFYVVFKNFISADLAQSYLAGAVLLGAAPCTAMELSDKRQCRLHSCPGRDQRFDHPCGIYTNCRTAAGNQRLYDSLDDLDSVSRSICCYPAGGWCFYQSTGHQT